MSPALVVLGALLLLLLYGVGLFNGLVRLRNLGDNAWSDVDVQLKKRHDLVPNLVETVKGYAKHEKDTFEQVVAARQRASSASAVTDRETAESALTRGLQQLFVLAEAYPELKANDGFLRLQTDLSRIEDEIASARRYYNAVVRDFNTQQETFPANLVAGALGFHTRHFFQAGGDERSAPQVKL